MLPRMKYLFLGEFLLLTQQNTKCLGEFLLLAFPNTKCLGELLLLAVSNTKYHDLHILAGR